MMEEKLLGIFAGVLDMPREELNMDLTRNDLDDWDSLAMVQIVDEVERQFAVQIPFGDIDGIRAIRDFNKYLA